MREITTHKGMVTRKAEVSRVVWQFQIGDLVHYNHSGEAFLIESRRLTNNACTVDRIEYYLNGGPAGFWAEERQLTLDDRV